jgi:tripeptide aminopeptidase
VVRASREERDRLLEDFVRLCEVESPSRHERRVADLVGAELRTLGLRVEEDASAAETGADAGNLIARIPGPPGAPTVLLCAHLDTVPLAAPVEVVREDDAFSNRNDAILGADNKAAVATILATARRLVRTGSPVGVELVFTTCEELALRGAKALDRAALRADFGFVFDHATPIGELILAAPVYYRIEAELLGRAAHAGICPEQGRNAIAAAASALAAIRVGRLDAETTANVGRIEGGTASNVVAERCLAELEVRSVDPARAAEVVSEVCDRFADAAHDHDCDVEVATEEQFRAYRLQRTAHQVAVAARALQRLRIEPRYVTTGGGSDANVLNAAGLPTVNVANGTERPHEPGERVTVQALETMLDVTLAIVAESAAA